MKRSKLVPLVIVPLLAACGADKDRYAYCVDRNNHVVDNRYCGDDRHGGSPAYWWYMTDSSIYHGNDIHRGTVLPAAGSPGARGFQQGPRIVSTNKTVVRTRVGGFGSTAKTTTSTGRSVSSGG